MTRIEVYDDGALVRARVVPNANVARVYREHQEAKGFRVLVFRPRTETERAA